MMATERGHWLDRPDLLIRAARHYEGAAQILIRHAVMTASQVSVTSGVTCRCHYRWIVARFMMAPGMDSPSITN